MATSASDLLGMGGMGDDAAMPAVEAPTESPAEIGPSPELVALADEVRGAGSPESYAEALEAFVRAVISI